MSSSVSTIPRSLIYRWRCPFGTFPIPSIFATCPNSWTVQSLRRRFHCADSRSHDFDEMTTAGPHPELSSFQDFALRNSEMLEFLVLRIRDFSNLDVSMALSFSGLFPSPWIYATCPLKLDSSDSTSRYRDLQCQSFCQL
jgi:hypothetical protein